MRAVSLTSQKHILFQRSTLSPPSPIGRITRPPSHLAYPSLAPSCPSDGLNAYVSFHHRAGSGSVASHGRRCLQPQRRGKSLRHFLNVSAAFAAPASLGRVTFAVTTVVAVSGAAVATTAATAASTTATATTAQRQAAKARQVVYRVSEAQAAMRSPLSLLAVPKVEPSLQVRARPGLGQPVRRLGRRGS